MTGTESNVPITPGTGFQVDGFIPASASVFRQTVTVGDPNTSANVQAVLNSSLASIGPQFAATEMAFMYGQANASTWVPLAANATVQVGNFPAQQAVVATLATVSVGNTLNALATVTQGTTPWQVTGTLTQASATLSVGNLLNVNLAQVAGTLVTVAAPGVALMALADATTVANVVAGDTGFNGVATASATKTYTFTTSSSGAQTLLANTPVEGYSNISIVFTSTGSGLVITGGFAPNSGGTYSSIASNSWYNQNPAQALTLTLNEFSSTKVVGNYFQLSISALTSGTVSGYVILSNSSMVPQIGLTAGTSYIGNVGSNSAVGSAVPANAFFMGLQSGSNLVGAQAYTTLVDSISGNSLQNLITMANQVAFNGVTYDRVRNNTTGVVVAAGATTTQTSSTITTYNASKLIVAINISAFTSGTLTFTVNGITSSGYTYPILVSTALGATGVTPLRIFPGSTPSANAVANDLVPRSFNVVVTGTFSATYGVDYELSV